MYVWHEAENTSCKDREESKTIIVTARGVPHLYSRKNYASGTKIYMTNVR